MWKWRVAVHINLKNVEIMFSIEENLVRTLSKILKFRYNQYLYMFIFDAVLKFKCLCESVSKIYDQN